MPKVNIEDVFSYHSPDANELDSIYKIRKVAMAFAKVVIEETPTCADQSHAIRSIRTALMFANAAVVLKGQV
jgi:hypothetical protein